MKIKITFYSTLLLGIIFLGFFLRIYLLSAIPSGFFADEASVGYNAYTILKSGTDEYGNPFPVFFKAFGEYKGPIEIYSTVPFIALFGLDEFSVRLTSVIYGTLSIIAIYLLTKEMLKKHKHGSLMALFSSLLLAISPWHIHFSRTAMEGLMPFVFFTTLGLYFFLKAQNNKSFFFLGTLTSTLALYSYFPARIFIPLFGLSIIILYFNFFLQNKKLIILNLVLLLILLTPLIHHTISPFGLSRWDQVNIFSQPPQDETIVRHIVNNYFSHFSYDFLFLKGDIDMSGQFLTRHSIRGMGELYFF